jgi:hypothetical protein
MSSPIDLDKPVDSYSPPIDLERSVNSYRESLKSQKKCKTREELKVHGRIIESRQPLVLTVVNSYSSCDDFDLQDCFVEM